MCHILSCLKMNSEPDLHKQEKDEQSRDTGHRSTFLAHVFNTGRNKKWNKPDSDQNCPQISPEAEPPAQSQQKGQNKHVRSNSDQRVKYTAERLKTCQTHQRFDVLNTDHKDVAMLHKFRPHLHTPKNLLKQIQRCFSLSSDSCFSAFLMSQ